MVASPSSLKEEKKRKSMIFGCWWDGLLVGGSYKIVNFVDSNQQVTWSLKGPSLTCPWIYISEGAFICLVSLSLTYPFPKGWQPIDKKHQPSPWDNGIRHCAKLLLNIANNNFTCHCLIGHFTSPRPLATMDSLMLTSNKSTSNSLKSHNLF